MILYRTSADEWLLHRPSRWAYYDRRQAGIAIAGRQMTLLDTNLVCCDSFVKRAYTYNIQDRKGFRPGKYSTALALSVASVRVASTTRVVAV